MPAGTVTLANSRFSLANGMAFVDFSAANTLTPYINGKVKVTDSAGKSIYGYIHYNSSDDDRVYMTYASSGSSGITVADDSNLDYDTNNFYGGILETLPDYTPSAEVILDQKHDGANGRIFSLQPNGKLRLTINGTNYDSTVATGLTDGTQHFFSYSVTRETAAAAGSISFGVDGSALGASVTIPAGAPATVNNAVSQYILGTSSKREAGVAYKFYSYNRTLTPAEDLSLHQNGVADADKYGSQTELIDAIADRDFSGASSWTNVNCTTYDETDDLSLTMNTTNLYAYLPAAAMCGGSGMTLNKRYRLKYDAANVTGTVKFMSYNGAVLSPAIADGTNQTWEFTWTETHENRSLLVINKTAGAGAIDLDNLSLVQIGATLDLEPAGIGAASWTDSSSNGLNASYPTTGWSVYPLGNGVRLTNSRGGSTYNLTAASDGTFNAEDASGYTYRITRAWMG